MLLSPFHLCHSIQFLKELNAIQYGGHEQDWRIEEFRKDIRVIYC